MKTKILMIAVLFFGGLMLAFFQNGSNMTNALKANSHANEIIMTDSIGADPIVNYPDPFCAVTTIEYRLIYPTWVRLSVTCPDLKSEILVFDFQEAGTYQVTYDACKKPCGYYMATLETYYCEEQEIMIKIHSPIAPMPGIE